jgi:hypothetical protein
MYKEDKREGKSVMKQALIYLRASTNEQLQENSIAVQRAIVTSFCERNGYEITQEFVEYASGTDDNRTLWNDALSLAVREGKFLICWKVDRASRSLSIFSAINKHLHLLRFAELGDVEPNPILLSCLIAAGQAEVLNTKTRIKETMRILALTEGRVWGNPRIKETAIPAGLKVRKANALSFNLKVQKIVADLKVAGYSLTGCVTRLNEMNIKTRRGKGWNYQSLYRVLNYKGA